MPGRLRQGTGFSDKAQGCCNKCCEAVCRVSPWNKLICYSLILLMIASLLMIIGGAFAAQGTDNTMALICGPDTIKLGNGSVVNNVDPRVPLLRQNANVWWLANAGIFAMIMVVMSFCCCGGFVVLCCGFPLPLLPRVLAVIAFILLFLGLTLFCGWLAMGSWLISTFGPEAVLSNVCRGIIAYVVFMYVYLFVFIGAFVASCIWAFHGAVDGKDDEKKTSRVSAESKPPELPSGTKLKLMKAMI